MKKLGVALQGKKKNDQDRNYMGKELRDINITLQVRKKLAGHNILSLQSGGVIQREFAGSVVSLS